MNGLPLRRVLYSATVLTIKFVFYNTVIQKPLFLIMIIHSVPGDATDISALKEAQVLHDGLKQK